MRIDTPEIAIVNDASEDADAVTTVDSSAKLPTRVKEVVKVNTILYAFRNADWNRTHDTSISRR